MLEIKNLSKKFGNQQVLDHISLKIEKGKVIAVIGHSLIHIGLSLIHI